MWRNRTRTASRSSRRADGLLRAAALATAAVLAAAGVRAHPAPVERIRAASAAIDAEPARADLYLERADLLRIHGELVRAERDYARALALDPALDAVHLGRARLLLAQGDGTAALAEVDAYRRRAGDGAPALLLRARILEGEDRPAEALQDLDLALAALRHPQPEHYLRRARLAAGLGDPDGAIFGLEMAMARVGPLDALVELAAELEAARGRVDAAVRRLDAAARASGRPAAFLAREAELLAAAGRRLEALAAATEALDALDARSPASRDLPVAATLRARVEAVLRSPPPGEGGGS